MNSVHKCPLRVHTLSTDHYGRVNYCKYNTYLSTMTKFRDLSKKTLIHVYYNQPTTVSYERCRNYETEYHISHIEVNKTPRHPFRERRVVVVI